MNVVKIPAYTTLLLALLVTVPLRADIPNPVLSSIYPPGGTPDSQFTVTVAGATIDHSENLFCPHPDISFEKLSDTEFNCTVGPNVKPGRYTVQLYGKRGLSSSRILLVNSLPCLNEEDPSEAIESDTNIELPVALHGAIGANGDIDRYVFTAQADEVILIECWAQRIDSTLRSKLEIYDANNRKLQTEQHQFGTDTMLAVRIPATGQYTVQLSDLIYSGAATSLYRLEIHSQPRTLNTLPSAVTTGTTAEVQCFGYNLGGKTVKDTLLESLPLQLSSAQLQSDFRIPAFADSTSATVASTPVVPHKSIHPVDIAVIDYPVIANSGSNVDRNTSLPIEIPIDISGHLPNAQDRHWYQIQLHAGQAITIESIGARIGSPVDLAVHVFSEDNTKQLEVLNDEPFNIGGTRFPTAHFDATATFIAPADGIYHLVVRNRIGNSNKDYRRTYRLKLNRQQPDFTVVAIGKLNAPTGLTVRPGGHETIHLLATTSSSHQHSIRVTASGLPPGVTCEDAWIGPGIRQIPLTISATDTAEPFIGSFQLHASIDVGGQTVTQRVLPGTMNRTDLPLGSGRLESDFTLSVTDAAPITATASIDRERYQQGSIIDLNITVDRREGQPDAEVKLNGDSLPPQIQDHVTSIDSGESQGVASFYIPEHLPPGMYTIAARVRTTHSYPLNPSLGAAKEAATTILTNAVSFEVYPAPYIVRIDLDAPKKIKRGQVIQMPYSCIRNNQFIGKIHTEIRAPGGVVGIRGRGVTFVGQTETGVIQIIANDDAPLGKQPGLRLEGLGTVEDEGIHLGSAFLDLEIVE